MTVGAHIYPDYSPRLDPTPNIAAALNRMALYRIGIRAFTRAELQADCVAYDQALRESLADRDAMCIRAAVNATSDQQEYIAALEAVKDAAIAYANGDIGPKELTDAVITYTESYEGAAQ